jgi:bacillithiol biosynthesis deacetylase BshB1
MNENQPYDLLAIGAHPDDIEVGCGGVLLDLNRRGKKTGIVILTEGEMGTGGTAEIRAQELKHAAEILGSDVIQVFNWGDTKLEDSYDKRLKLAEVIRRCRPKVILAPYPHVGHGRRQSHPDHVAAGVIAINSANVASLKKVEVNGEPHLVTRIFHYFLPPGVSPNFVVNITPYFDQWMDALKAHKSQFLNPDKSRDYLESLASMARTFGMMARCQYGQGFYSVEPILVEDVMTLAIGDDMIMMKTQPDPHSTD